VPVKLSRTPGEHARLPGPALGEHTEEVLLAAGYSHEQVAELLERGAAAGSAEAPAGATFRA
jgi:formyl-CoA transferase